MEWSAMKQVFNWKDGDNLNFQYFYCLLKMANDMTCHECPMSLTKQITITVTKSFGCRRFCVRWRRTFLLMSEFVCRRWEKPGRKCDRKTESHQTLITKQINIYFGALFIFILFWLFFFLLASFSSNNRHKQNSSWSSGLSWLVRGQSVSALIRTINKAVCSCSSSQSEVRLRADSPGGKIFVSSASKAAETTKRLSHYWSTHCLVSGQFNPLSETQQ